MQAKVRIGVIIGGMSIERDVSLNSGRTICDHLDTHLYDVIPLFHHTDGSLYILPWRFLHRGKTADFAHRLAHEATAVRWDDLPDIIDFLFSAQHGQHGEDGSIQGMCEVLGIPYLGSGVYASSHMMDKWTQRELMRDLDIACPRTTRIPPHALSYYQDNPHALTALLEEQQLTFPLIVKPRFEGSSLGVSKVHTRDDLLTAMSHAMHIEQHPQDALVQEVISGMEICQILIAEDRPNNLRALPPTEIVQESGTEVFDYSQKYMPGRADKHTPARCSAEVITRMQRTAEQIAQAYDLRTFVRVDYIVADDGTLYVIDINIFPGTAPSGFPFLQAAEIGLSHADLINRCISVELQARGMQIQPAHQGTAMQRHDTRLRVGVLLGGACHEREVSLESGRNACYKLSPHRYQVTPIFMSSEHKLYAISQRQLVRNTTEEIERLVTESERIYWHDLPEQFDFIFLGLHGGIGENGAVQATLDMLKLPYNGPGARTSSLCMDKHKVHNWLTRHGFHVPRHVYISRDTWNAGMISHDIPYPVVVKPHDDGSSMHVVTAHNEDELRHAMSEIFADNNNGALVEERIAGMELTVGVIGNEHPFAMPPSYAVAQSDILSMEEKFLPGAGENQTPAPLDAATCEWIRREVEQAYYALGCQGYSRIDCFYQSAEESPTGEARVVFLEPNTLPALTPATCIFHQAAEIGLKPMEFFDTLVQLGLARFHADQPTRQHIEQSIRGREAI